MRNLQQILKSQKRVTTELFKQGDYVFATKYEDADPYDRWQVGIINHVSDAAFFSETGVIPFKWAQHITAEEGAMILKEIPKH